MGKEKTRYDRIIDRIKNNKITALLIAVGTIIIAVSVFTNAVQTIWLLIKKDEKPTILKVDGTWVSKIMEGDLVEWGPVRDRVDPYSYRYVFELESVGEDLFGEVSYLRGELGKIPKENKKSWAILDGKIAGGRVSFSTKNIGYKVQYDPSRTEAWNEPYEYLITYNGTIVNDKIRFIRQDQRGLLPEIFNAKRLKPNKHH